MMLSTCRRLLPSLAAQSGRAASYALVAMCAALAVGCSGGLDTSYGTSSRRYLPTSINGTDVLLGMFADAGHDVSSRRILYTSTVHQIQTFVWFPNDDQAPGDDVCAFFDEWLQSGTGRTLVYVGRSFDAAPLYFRKMIARAPRDEQPTYRRAEKRSKDADEDADESARLACDWFEIERGVGHYVNELSGPWAAGVQSAKTEIEMTDQLTPTGEAEELLAGEGEVIAWRYTGSESHYNQIIVVANGSFLLNVPLVNHEHRKLAGKLIEEVGAPGRVVFLESGPGDPPIDPEGGESPLARLFGAWPLGIILLHSAVLGIIFCFARWPIFGRPKSPPAETITDFGHHVSALGELLERTRDRAYAFDKLPSDVEAAKADAAGARQSTTPT
jgi:hypothetical protein